MDILEFRFGVGRAGFTVLANSTMPFGVRLKIKSIKSQQDAQVNVLDRAQYSWQVVRNLMTSLRDQDCMKFLK